MKSHRHAAPAGSLWRLRVAVWPESEDAVSCLLESVLGEPASIQTDLRKGRSWATVYLPKKSAWTAARRRRIENSLRGIVACGLRLPRIHVAAARLANEDWAESWKRHFRPLAVGRALLVRPSWSRRRARPNQAVLTLDPGLSFGTGHHPTTRFCLEHLVDARVRLAKRSLLDAGCGSGILAIAALKVGYEHVEAFDFDPAAVRIARANAALNDVESALKLARKDLTRLPHQPPRRFDVVCANLTADILVSEAGKLARLVAPEGLLILAGILANQFHDVRQAFEKQGFRMTHSTTQREWRSGRFRRE